MRNATILPLSMEEYLIMSCDNSGGIGEKEQDLIHIPYEILSYYAFRVAVMECMASGGKPNSVFLQNLTGESNWEKLTQGVQKGLSELNMNKVSITGSSETNFQLNQSAIGIVVTGISKNPKIKIPDLPNQRWAVIGKPLVGPSVVEQPDSVAPLTIFKSMCELEDVSLWPVGSMGIFQEIIRIFQEQVVQSIKCPLEVHVSAGPSTCFIIAYPSELENQVQDISGDLFHPIDVIL